MLLSEYKLDILSNLFTRFPRTKQNKRIYESK